MRVSLHPGWVLHSRPYRETSLLVEALAREYGRVGLVARGARSARSKLRGMLQPFQPLLISWVGRGELCTLTGAEAAGVPPLMPSSSYRHAFYMQELLLRLLHRNDPHPGLFDAYGEALDALGESPGSEEPVLRVFENALLQELGYGLVLDHDVGDGSPIADDRVYTYHLEHGPMAGVAEESGIEVSGAALTALASGRVCKKRHLQEIKRLMRAALSLYLGDRPLKSRELFQDVQDPGDRENAKQ